MSVQAVASCLSSHMVLVCACSWWTAQPRSAQHIVLLVHG